MKSVQLRLRCVAMYLIGKAADDESHDFKGREGHPIVRVRHIEMEKRFREKVIETPYGNHRDRARFWKSPLQRDGCNQEQVNRSRRREVEVKAIGDARDEQRCGNTRSDPDSETTNSLEEHSLVQSPLRNSLRVNPLGTHKVPDYACLMGFTIH